MVFTPFFSNFFASRRRGAAAASSRCRCGAVTALPVAPDRALIDGNRMPDLPCPGATIVGGDAKILSIAAASMIATSCACSATCAAT